MPDDNIFDKFAYPFRTPSKTWALVNDAGVLETGDMENIRICPNCGYTAPDRDFQKTDKKPNPL